MRRIFGRPVTHPAHKSDLVRLAQLKRRGGVYLDLDVICVSSFTPLRNQTMVLGRESEAGLCNAVILARPGAAFIDHWLASYRDFDGRRWAEHSIHRPHVLAEAHPEALTVVSRDAFYFPFHTDPPHILWMPRSRALADPVLAHDVRYRIRRHLSKLVRSSH